MTHFNGALRFANAPYLAKTIGKGFDETMVSLGSNDIQEALDRRVEF